ncbi:MAG: phosphotransferase [Rhodospirillaceae bacterium]|mgnify:FL=1|nr:phosphotransferase [Rhodospirillaceae bacterium]MBT3629041.1 phosphotransferase [Rhodospirillaceae bacterium]MBT3926593.1 phosphotransferase [Rhodospirillaceae bacterium]MBT5037530.1 phosphotransferase [Rhodospirillaceae bacterium]MBT5676370.1 phosphotransferase [Rhodospirillaceae bacterium]
MTDFYTIGLDARAERMAHLAVEALKSWGITDCTPELVKIRENAVFRVPAPGGGEAALRIHRHAYHSDVALESELQWMRALQQDGIDVPAIVPTQIDALFITESVASVPEPRQVDMVRWLPGVPLGTLEEGLSAAVHDIGQTFTQVGRLVGELHNHAANWPLPEGFQRHAWDVDGLTGEQPFWGRFWEFPGLDAAQRALLERARDTARDDLFAIGQPKENYGLIHSDLNLDNMLLHDGRVMAIDFDDCGFGWHLFDLATISILFRGTDDYDQIHQSLITGYRQVRDLSDELLELMPLFYLLRAFTYVGWVHTRNETHTAQEIAAEVVATTCELADSYLRK